MKEPPNHYPHLALLQADILRRCAEDKDPLPGTLKSPHPITRHIEVSPSNPIHFAPTIAMKRAPSTEELVKAKLSRFQTQKKPRIGVNRLPVFSDRVPTVREK